VKAVIHINNAAHQQQHAAWMREGLRRHGVDVRFAPWNVATQSDLVVIWGWKQQRVIAAAQKRGTPILVMERGHLPPRMEWTSCGLNGLGNRGTYARCEDSGARWRKHFGHLEQPWREHDGYALVCGQVIGDASLWGCDFRRWAQDTTSNLASQHRPVVYRGHPLSIRHGDRWCPRGAKLSTGTLAEDLAGASLVITYNSTVGVETVLGGFPTVTFDQGAMAWPVTAHSLNDAPVRPNRTEWMRSLAWTSWRPNEIANGAAWDHLQQLPVCTAANTATSPTHL
jgi:hypothetical protein